MKQARAYNERLDANAQVFRERIHGFAAPDDDPLGQVVAVVEYDPVVVGVKSFVPEVRIVETGDETLFFEGGIGDNVRYEDAQKLLNHSGKSNLTRAMNRVTQRKTNRIIDATKR